MVSAMAWRGVGAVLVGLRVPHQHGFGGVVATNLCKLCFVSGSGEEASHNAQHPNNHIQQAHRYMGEAGGLPQRFEKGFALGYLLRPLQGRPFAA